MNQTKECKYAEYGCSYRYTGCSNCISKLAYNKGYNKAIDDFVDDEAVDEGFLQNWYQFVPPSINGKNVPIWTDEHISEVCEDFYLIPKETIDRLRM